MDQVSWESRLLLPPFDLQPAIDLGAKAIGSQRPITKVRQPPAWIDCLENCQDVIGDDVFTGRPQDQRAAEFAFLGQVTKRAGLSVCYARMSWTTLPWTSVNRKSRPL